MKSAKNKEYPWFALYQCDNAIFGGALIDNNIILTTAHSAKHCDNLGIKPLELILGENEANILEGSERLFRIENVRFLKNSLMVEKINFHLFYILCNRYHINLKIQTLMTSLF